MRADDNHHDRCERRFVGENRFWICHCARRRRIARGLTELPTADLDFPPPSCPNCWAYLSNDGDSWRCEACHIEWDLNGNGSSATFTDTYAESDVELATQADEWARKAQERAS